MSKRLAEEARTRRTNWMLIAMVCCIFVCVNIYVCVWIFVFLYMHICIWIKAEAFRFLIFVCIHISLFASMLIVRVLFINRIKSVLDNICLQLSVLSVFIIVITLANTEDGPCLIRKPIRCWCQCFAVTNFMLFLRLIPTPNITRFSSIVCRDKLD